MGQVDSKEGAGMIVLSLFDGMSCGQIALNRLGIKIDKYYASEIDKHAIKATQHRFPNTIQLGSVVDVKGADLPSIDLLLAGSPCQGFSFAGKGLNFEDPRSKLFFEYVRILNELRENNPHHVKFLLENVSMKKEHEEVITGLLWIKPIRINSALVSAQNRNRLYWTNIGLEEGGLFGELQTAISPPKDKYIILKHILQDEVDSKYFLSDQALARIDRTKYSKPKINPSKTGTLNTKNNSGQLSVDSGTTLIQIASLYDNNSDAGRIYSDAGRIYSDEGKARTLKGESGGMGGKMGLYQVGVLNDRGSLRESNEKANCIDANFHKGMDNHGPLTMVVVHNTMPRTGGKKQGGTGPISKTDGKTYCLDTSGATNAIEISANAKIRRLTPVECCRLQTVPDDHFNGSGVSETQQYRMLGNGWTIDVICHILSYIR